MLISIAVTENVALKVEFYQKYDLFERGSAFLIAY